MNLTQKILRMKYYECDNEGQHSEKDISTQRIQNQTPSVYRTQWVPTYRKMSTIPAKHLLSFTVHLQPVTSHYCTTEWFNKTIHTRYCATGHLGSDSSVTGLRKEKAHCWTFWKKANITSKSLEDGCHTGKRLQIYKHYFEHMGKRYNLVRGHQGYGIDTSTHTHQTSS